ncbi:MAG TPA: hypothetical protein EYG86_01480 [Crocinitomicaceae bacterium]|nr:hypothetical protein [Crocinitomicaceae bacterium]
MRLTVHVENAKNSTGEKNTKEGIVKFKQTFNTLSYSDVNPDEVNAILNSIQANGLGTPTKHYLTNEKIPGHSRGKKK